MHERIPKEELWLERAKTNPIMDMPIMEVCKAYYYMIGARLYNATGNYELCIDNLENMFQRRNDYVIIGLLWRQKRQEL